MPPKFIFFDLGNTLVKIKDEILENCATRIATEYNLKPSRIDVKTIIEELKRAETNEWNETEAERISQVKTSQQELIFWIEFYTSVLKRLGIFAPTIELITFLAQIPMDWTSFDLFEDVPETLEVLKQQGFLMGIISNAFPSASHIVKYFGLAKWFDYIILSYEHDTMPKPHPQIYEIAIKQAKIRINNKYSLVYIDDRPSFAEGAFNANLGIYAILIDRELQAQDGLYEKITSLRQVPESLGNYACQSHWLAPYFA